MVRHHKTPCVEERELNCPNCRNAHISSLRRVFATAEYPVVCGACGQRSLPGTLPRSELQRVAVATPLMLLLLGGAKFFSFLPWIQSLLLALPLTFLGLASLQLRLQLMPVSSSALQTARAYNMMACIAIAALGLLPWVV